MYDTGIYEIVNTTNGFRYVGSALKMRNRWRQHIAQLGQGRHHSRYLQRSWDKYGSDSFRFRAILWCAKGDLIHYEQTVMDGLSPEYNVAPVAGSQLGYRHTEKTREKMRISRAKTPSSGMKGRTHSPEIRARMSESRKGKGGGVYTPERIARCATAMIASKSVMNPDKVRLVRSLRLTGLTAPAIAEIVGCTKHVVYDILSKRRFSTVV